MAVGAVFAILGAITASVTDAVDEFAWPLALGGFLVFLVGAFLLSRQRGD